MRYKTVFFILLSTLCATAKANWTKINSVDYTWGPFNIYHITLFTETGKYEAGTRPLMLTLQYKKPWEGRDFAVSLARTWKNLGIELPEDEVDNVITHLRKTFPDIKPEDRLHYIALEDKGYFILNDKVVSDVFNKTFNDAIVAIWLDPKMDISHQLLDPSYKPQPKMELPSDNSKEQASIENQSELVAKTDVEKANAEKQNNEEVEESKAESVNADVMTEHKTEQVTIKVDESRSEKITEEKKEQEKAEKPKSEEKGKAFEIQNPELFISPIYDDILMLQKPYV